MYHGRHGLLILDTAPLTTRSEAIEKEKKRHAEILLLSVTCLVPVHAVRLSERLEQTRRTSGP